MTTARAPDTQSEKPGRLEIVRLLLQAAQTFLLLLRLLSD